jgi:hypothetical protein
MVEKTLYSIIQEYKDKYDGYVGSGTYWLFLDLVHDLEELAERAEQEYASYEETAGSCTYCEFPGHVLGPRPDTLRDGNEEK